MAEQTYIYEICNIHKIQTTDSDDLYRNVKGYPLQTDIKYSVTVL